MTARDEVAEYTVTVEMRFTDRGDAQSAHAEAGNFAIGLAGGGGIGSMAGCRVEIDTSRPGDYGPLADEIGRKVAERIAGTHVVAAPPAGVPASASPPGQPAEDAAEEPAA